jgi:hypothetical protein
MVQLLDDYERRIDAFRSRTNSGCYDSLNEKQQHLYSVVKNLGGENGEQIIEVTAVKAGCKPFFDMGKTRMHLTDFCYNLINRDDKPNKFLMREGSGIFRFIDFDWQCEQGMSVTWKTKELRTELMVGEYKHGIFQWKFNELKEKLEQYCISHGLTD